eukprot:IDg8758t1
MAPLAFSATLPLTAAAPSAWASTDCPSLRPRFSAPAQQRARLQRTAATMSVAAAPPSTELFVPEIERAARKSEAASMPSVPLTDIDMQWLHVLAEGWAAPLRGFMREKEYLQALHFNALR